MPSAAHTFEVPVTPSDVLGDVIVHVTVVFPDTEVGAARNQSWRSNTLLSLFSRRVHEAIVLQLTACSPPRPNMCSIAVCLYRCYRWLCPKLPGCPFVLTVWNLCIYVLSC